MTRRELEKMAVSLVNAVKDFDDFDADTEIEFNETYKLVVESDEDFLTVKIHCRRRTPVFRGNAS